MMKYRQMVVSIVGLALLTFGEGCGPGGPEIAPVSGRITLDDKPLARAAIVFIPENGRPAGATTDADGNYVLNFSEGRCGAIPGKCTVRITTKREAYQDASGKGVPGSKEMIPVQYNQETTLTFDVLPKKNNVANFDLKSGGRVASGE